MEFVYVLTVIDRCGDTVVVLNVICFMGYYIPSNKKSSSSNKNSKCEINQRATPDPYERSLRLNPYNSLKPSYLDILTNMLNYYSFSNLYNSLIIEICICRFIEIAQGNVESPVRSMGYSSMNTFKIT